MKKPRLSADRQTPPAAPSTPPSEEPPSERDDASEEDESAAFVAEEDELERAAKQWKAVEPLPAITQLGSRHIAYVRSLLARFAISPAYEREDIVQEVLIQAHRSRDSPFDARALLWGITRYVVLRWLLKRHNAQQTLRSFVEDETRHQEQLTVEDMRRLAERRAAVHKAIDELPEMFREVFERTELEDAPMPEVTQQLGIPLNTGYTRLYIARGRFAEALKRVMLRLHLDPEDLCLPVVLGELLDLGSGFGGAPPRLDAPPAELQGPPGAGGPLAEVVGRLGGLASSSWLGGGIVAAATLTVLCLWPPPPSAEMAGAATTVVIAEAPAAPIEREPARPDDSAAASASSVASATPLAAAAPAAHLASAASAAPRSGQRAATKMSAAATSSATAPPPRPAEGSLSRKVLTLLCSGKAAEAQQKADDLRRLYPNSAYLSQIDEALAKGRSAQVDVEGCFGYRTRSSR